MNKTLSTTLTVLAILALAVVAFLAGSLYARMNAFVPGNMMSGYGWNNSKVYGPNMMGGNGGMMSSGGKMGGSRYNHTNFAPLTIDQAKTAAGKYLANLNNPDLEIAEIMIFDNNGYVVVKEASTGVGAFELLVDPVSQTASLEHGPNMMWNLKYGGVNHQYMMGGSGGMMGNMMMGGNGNMMQGWDTTTPLDFNAPMTVKPEQAIEYAQKYLDANIPGATAATDPLQFYGYYTLDFEKDGKVAGMLSVNGYSGQIFLHTWHGTFAEETEYE
jgi:hypothetical protein